MVHKIVVSPCCRLKIIEFSLCENRLDREAAVVVCRAINVPLLLLKALQGQLSDGPPGLLVHISTDQVYSGSDKLSTEDATPAPVNEYGASKLESEETIAAEWPHHIILRSSIIYGPQALNPVERPLFVQFIVCSSPGTADVNDGNANMDTSVPSIVHCWASYCHVRVP
jgi:nucleoside-diphosphate-sugar epimerase